MVAYTLYNMKCLTHLIDLDDAAPCLLCVLDSLGSVKSRSFAQIILDIDVQLEYTKRVNQGDDLHV